MVTPELMEKAAVHIPTCAYIALMFFPWIVLVVILVVMTIAGVVFVVVGIASTLKRAIVNRTFSRRSRQTPIEGDRELQSTRSSHNI